MCIAVPQVAFAAFTDFGAVMALAIAVHNIPEVILSIDALHKDFQALALQKCIASQEAYYASYARAVAHCMRAGIGHGLLAAQNCVHAIYRFLNTGHTSAYCALCDVEQNLVAFTALAKPI